MTLSLLALSLIAVTAYAQDKKCGSCKGDCAVRRADKIAKLFSLDEAKKAEVLALNQALMANCPSDASPETCQSKSFKKEMKAAKKSYDKSLKQLLGKKNFKALKSYDKVECNAIKAQAKVAAKAEAKAVKAKK